MPDPQKILEPLKIPDNVKADAFDAFHSASSADDLASKLKKLPLAENVKADLWDAKNAEGVAIAAPAAPPAAGGFFHNAGQLIGGVVDAVNPLPAIQRYAIQPALDVARSIHDGDGSGFLGAVQRLNVGNAMGADIAESQVGQGKQAVDLARQGRYTEAAGHGAAALLPVLGPAAAQAGETIGGGLESGNTGQVLRGVGQGAGLVGSVLAPHAIAPASKATGAVATRAADAVASKFNSVLDTAPRPLSPEASALANRLNVPLTRGMSGGSKTVQAAEKMLGHSVAPDLYEPLLERARQGVTAGAKDVSGGFAVDRYTAGQNTLDAMLDAAKGHESTANTEYDNLREHEANPDNTRSVQVGMKENPSTDPGAPQLVPDMQPVKLPTDMRPVKQAVQPFIDEVQRRMTPAQRNSDPGLSALQNIIGRPDALPASVAEADLGYLKDIQRSDATPQAKRLASIAINALQPAIDSAVSAAGPEALKSLTTARGSWAARSSILDEVKGLANDTTGRSGQVLLTQKLLQPSDASFPALERVLNVAPGAAQDLGKAYLTDRVFAKAANGDDFTNPQQAQNLWNQMGSRTKAALFTPEQIGEMGHFLDLAKRVAENPNPSGTGIINTLLKMGVMVTHPISGAAGFAAGRKLANLLYFPGGTKALAVALTAPDSAAGLQAAATVKAAMTATANPPAGSPSAVPDFWQSPPTDKTAFGVSQPGAVPPALPATITPNATTQTTTQTSAPPGGLRATDTGAIEPRPTLPQSPGTRSSPASADTVVTVPGEARRYSGTYQVRELSDVQPSHSGHNFQPNPRYQLRNDRNYDNPVNQAKIVDWSAQGPTGFDPSELVNDARNSSTGPPVLDSAGNILGGNGRGMILQRVYKSNPAGAQAYRDLIMQKAAQFGIDPEQVAGMKQPVLTRVLHDSELTGANAKQNAVTDFNKSGTAALTPNERAIADSRRVSTSTLDDVSRRLDKAGDGSTLAEVLEGKSGIEVLNNLVADGVVAPQERAAFTSENQLTKAGRDRISALMTGRYFGTASQMDQVPPSIRNKVERMAAPLAHVEGNADFNLSPKLQEAMSILEDANAHGAKNIDDYLQQKGLFAEQQFSRGGVALAKQLLTRDPTALQAAARAYASDAKFASENNGAADLFGNPPPTAAEAFEKYFGPEALADEAATKASVKAAASQKSQTGKAK
jgi:DdrB-like nuclease